MRAVLRRLRERSDRRLAESHERYVESLRQRRDRVDRQLEQALRYRPATTLSRENAVPAATPETSRGLADTYQGGSTVGR